MKSLFFAAIIVLSTAVCSAFTYELSALFTVTSTDDQRVALGETFTGTFRYEADAVDGRFYSYWPGGPQAVGNTSLTAQITMPDSLVDGFTFDEGYTFLGPGRLDVVTGIIANFSWTLCLGPWVFSIIDSDWAALDHIYDLRFPGERGGGSVGSVQFEQPYRIGELPVSVPDSPIPLLGLAFLFALPMLARVVQVRATQDRSEAGF